LVRFSPNNNHNNNNILNKNNHNSVIFPFRRLCGFIFLRRAAGEGDE
jgi:hypothetical protein